MRPLPADDRALPAAQRRIPVRMQPGDLRRARAGSGLGPGGAIGSITPPVSLMGLAGGGPPARG